MNLAKIWTPRTNYIDAWRERAQANVPFRHLCNWEAGRGEEERCAGVLPRKLQSQAPTFLFSVSICGTRIMLIVYDFSN